MLKDYDGIITGALNLRCVSVKYGCRCKKKGGQVDIIGNYENGIKRKKSAVEIKKLPAASNAVGSKRINKSDTFIPFIFS